MCDRLRIVTAVETLEVMSLVAVCIRFEIQVVRFNFAFVTTTLSFANFFVSAFTCGFGFEIVAVSYFIVALFALELSLIGVNFKTVSGNLAFISATFGLANVFVSAFTGGLYLDVVAVSNFVFTLFTFELVLGGVDFETVFCCGCVTATFNSTGDGMLFAVGRFI